MASLQIPCQISSLQYKSKNQQQPSQKKTSIYLTNMQRNPPQLDICQQQIKTYIRIFPSMGIDPILDQEYQVIDGNTFLCKKERDNEKYKMHTLNYIFNCQFQNWKQLQHMNIVDDCFQGKNQLIISDIHKDFFQHFLDGTVEDPSFIISLFNGLFNQTFYQSVQKTKEYSQKRIKKQQNISISVFSTQGNSNNFIDLIVGQKFIFYSKKDMDDHKDFYSKQITQMRQFLILLKIAYIHYKECCNQSDPIVFRIVVDSYDQVKNANYTSTLHLVVCQSQSKIVQDVGRKIQLSLNNSYLKGEDHGSLANYLQKYLRKCKIIYIYGIPYRKSIMENSTSMFKFLAQLKNNKVEFQRSIINLTPQSEIQQINKFTLPKHKFNSYNFNHKQTNQSLHLLQRLCQFLIETQSKWKSYCKIFQQIINIQQQFYQRQRFPISLQIQQYNIKSFIISKIYRLSETYQMDDLSIQMQKLRTIKNQITISYKAIANCKQFAQISNNSHMDVFVKYFNLCMNEIVKILKTLFGLNYRSVQIYALQINNNIQIQRILDNKILKNLMHRLKNQGKKLEQKQRVFLRKIQIQNIATQIKKLPLNSLQQSSRTTQIKQNKIQLSSSKTYDLFQKQRRLNTNKISNFSINIANLVINNKNLPQKQKGSHILKRKNIITGLIHNNSTLITNQNEERTYNFSLPKIAVIQRARKIK